MKVRFLTLAQQETSDYAMSFDLQRIIESKREMRRKLAGQPVAEKLAMLDALRDRARTILKAATRLETALLRESQPEYRVNPRKD